MADIPDYSVKQVFPISSVISAAQQNAALQQQARQQGQQSLIEGLQSIGQIGQSLAERRREMAQSLAMAHLIKGKLDAQAMPDAQKRVQQLAQNNAISAANAQPVTQSPFGPVSLGQTASGSPGADPTSNTYTQSTIPSALMSKFYKAPTQEDVQANLGTPDVQTIQQAIHGLDPKTLISQLLPQQTLYGVLDPTTGAPVGTPTSAPKGSHFSSAALPQPVMTKEEALKAGKVEKGTRIIDPSRTNDGKDIHSPDYQNKLEQKYREARMKVFSNRSGGLGLQDSKVSQAIDLRKLVNKYYDPKTGQFNIPPSQHSELALGLARLVSPTGQVGIDLMRELKQATGREALAKALIYAGADPSKVGGPTQDVARMFIDSIDRQGQTAEQLRDQDMAYISDTAPVDLDPERKAKIDKARLNSFNDFLSQSPDRSGPSSAPLTADEQAEFEQLHKRFGGAKS